MIVSESFEEKYISLRKKENRLYTDEQVRWLPEIERSHPHYSEWDTRKSSCNKLIQHLRLKKKSSIYWMSVAEMDGSAIIFQRSLEATLPGLTSTEQNLSRLKESLTI